MEFEKFAPGTILNKFVESFVFINIPLDQLNKNPNVFIPNGNVVLVIHLAGSMVLVHEGTEIILPKVFFTGLLNSRADLKPTGDLNSIFVVFRPNALYHLFALSMCELNGKLYADTENIINGGTDTLYQQLLDAENKGRCVQVLETFFESLIKNRTFKFDITDSIIDRIIKDEGYMRVTDIIQYYNVAERTLRRNFLLKTGYPPKEFVRIIRFKFIMQQLQNGTTVSWTDMVNATDLVDQSHFIKEFKRFTGSTPNRIKSMDQQFLRMINGTV
jgi:AraC-like DNA-binding protein